MRLLHVGCGGDPLPAWFGDVDETRLDIDPDVRPHIVASMLSMGEIGGFDALWCSHALEHLACFEVPIALSEFKRVLRPGGYAMIVVPDLEGVTATEEVLYHAPCGPITGRDMIYGHEASIRKSPYMQHRTGFVQSTMLKALEAAGFARSEARRMSDYNLLGIGIK